ncbi:MAG TPA: FtsQ-type POTRA domain-containing protein [Gemmatimonadaceae bacterium]|nr:FtsQ-type POTRA domain-containing protein [Gemmatimonadaceae bacterium]
MSGREEPEDDAGRDDVAADGSRLPRWRLVLFGAALLVLLASPLWGPRALRHLAFFRVRKIEVNGLRYTPAADVLARLKVDTTRSVWDPLPPLASRVMEHPQVESAYVSRKLPGTLVVDVVERRPVALVPIGAELRAVDERGVTLPLDPSRTPVDAPVVTAPRAAAVYHLLGQMQREAPALYARISSIRPSGSDELLVQVADVPVRTMTSVTLARLSDIEPVERDLARRQLRAAELDLRYRDQVIARLP